MLWVGEPLKALIDFSYSSTTEWKSRNERPHPSSKGNHMSDTSAEREDDSIDLNNPEHVSYWTLQFGITPETLETLIKANGSRAADLRLVLGK